MAVKTVDIGGMKLNRTALVVAGAGAVGVVGYAWWTRGGSAAVTGEEEGAEDQHIIYDENGNPIGITSADEYMPPTVLAGNQSFGDQPTFRQPVYNAEWTQLIQDNLSSNGYDPIAVTNALGKYLNRQPLSTVEKGIVMAAIAVYGQPPQGNYSLVEQPPTAAPKKAAPSPVTGLRLTGKSRYGFGFTWNRSANADYYKVLVNSGVANVFVNTTTTGNQYLVGKKTVPGGQYMVRVRAERRGVGVTPYARLHVKLPK